MTKYQTEAENSGSNEKLGNSDCNSDPWAETDGFQLGKNRNLVKAFFVNGQIMDLELLWEKGDLLVKVHDQVYVSRHILRESEEFEIYPSSKGCFVVCGPNQIELEVPDQGLSSGVGDNRDGGVVLAPMHGKIVQILTEQGKRVDLGQSLIVLEAMKMEHIIRAPISGTVASMPVAPGQQVSLGDPVVEVIDETTKPKDQK